MTRWLDIVAKHPRVVLCGRSSVGKSTLARQVTDRPVHNTGVQGLDGDTPVDIGFKGTPYYWLERLAPEAGPWLLEGTQAARVARAWLRDSLGEPDAVVNVLGRFAPDDLGPDDLTADEDENERKRGVALSRAKGQDTIWRDYLGLREAFGAKAPVFEGDELWFSEEVG